MDFPEGMCHTGGFGYFPGLIVCPVTDITYICTWQGWLYLAAVIDLFVRNVVG